MMKMVSGRHSKISQKSSTSPSYAFISKGNDRTFILRDDDRTFISRDSDRTFISGDNDGLFTSRDNDSSFTSGDNDRTSVPGSYSKVLLTDIKVGHLSVVERQGALR